MPDAQQTTWVVIVAGALGAVVTKAVTFAFTRKERAVSIEVKLREENRADRESLRNEFNRIQDAMVEQIKELREQITFWRDKSDSLNEKYFSLMERFTTLQSEHNLLQQRFSDLQKQTASVHAELTAEINTRDHSKQ